MRRHKFLLWVTLLNLLSVMGLAQPQNQPQVVIPEAIIIAPVVTPLQVRVWTERLAYAPGDTLKIHFSVNQDANVYLYDITPDGRVTLIFPNAFQPVSFVKAGTYSLPHSNSYSFRVKEPYGIELLQALAVATPIVIPGGQFTPQNPFPLLSIKPKEFKSQMIDVLNSSVSQSPWATSWAQFVIESRETRLAVTSIPPGALVYIDGGYKGITPLQVSVSPGRVRIKLLKEGYTSWEETVTLQQGVLLPIEARLNITSLITPPILLVVRSQPSGAAVYVNGLYRGLTPTQVAIDPGYVNLQLRREGYESWATTLTLNPNTSGQEILAQLNPIAAKPPVTPPPTEQPVQPPVEQPLPPVSPSTPHPIEPDVSLTVRVSDVALGFNLGLNSSAILSLGADFGWRVGVGILSFGSSFLMTGQAVPEFNDIGYPMKFDYGERIFNSGPEVEVYLKVSALLFEVFALEIAGGFSFQEQAHVALAPDIRSVQELDVGIVPNGYTIAKVYLNGYAGIGLHLGNITISFLDHPRRGKVVSLSIHF
jgi:hypothetical protein